MNKKQRINEIKNAFVQSTPDVIERIDLSHIQNLGPAIDPNLFLSTKPFPLRISYKRLAFLFSMAIVLVIGTIYIGSMLPKTEAPMDNEFSYSEVSSSEATPLSHAIVGGTVILQQFLVELGVDPIGFVPNQPNVWQIESRLDRLHHYVPILYQMLSPQTTSEISLVESDRLDYQQKMIVPIKQMSGIEHVMVVYLNVTNDQTKEIVGMAMMEERTMYFDAIYTGTSKVTYRFYQSSQTQDKRIELTQDKTTNSITYHIKKVDGSTTVSDSVIEQTDNFVKLLLIKNNHIDVSFDVDWQEQLRATYEIAMTSVTFPNSADFPVVGDYQFERNDLGEVGTIRIYLDMDLLTLDEKIHFSITRPVFGSRTYVFDIED